jgi:hypothetical protein
LASRQSMYFLDSLHVKFHPVLMLESLLGYGNIERE